VSYCSDWKLFDRTILSVNEVLGCVIQSTHSYVDIVSTFDFAVALMLIKCLCIFFLYNQKF
jgi:hypothetical protein